MQQPVQHKHYLLEALELAKIQRGFCAPNPTVGAVIVSATGEILARGYHLGSGQAHAEIAALNNLHQHAENAINLQDATLYVTLEPCCHYGRTPPCTNAIIESGITKVVYAYRDPNPIVSGKGEIKLQEANINCQYIQIPEIDRFYQSYRYWHQTKKPFITAKIAMTMDGKIAGKDSRPIQITGAEINQFTHEQRKCHDAILTTIKTIVMDDPQLNVRIKADVPAVGVMSNNASKKGILSKPLYILDSQLNLPLNAKIFLTAKSITVFYANLDNKNKLQQLAEKNVRCVKVSHNAQGLDLNEIIQIIGQDGVHDLWIEAGGKCFSSFIKQKLLQRALIYIAPHTLKEGKTAFDDAELNFLKEKIEWKQIGKDVLCEVEFDLNE